jgi:hypothetical protein
MMLNAPPKNCTAVHGSTAAQNQKLATQSNASCEQEQLRRAVQSILAQVEIINRSCVGLYRAPLRIEEARS